MQTSRGCHCSPVIWLSPEPGIKPSRCIAAQGVEMQLRKFISKYKFTASRRTDQKSFEWWKVVVTGLMMTGAVLLFASLISSTASMKEKSSQDENATRESGGLHHDQKFDRKYQSKISRILPMAQVYCSVQSCVVTCSFIPAASNPGTVAAVFLDSDYKRYCPDNVLVEELIFENCKFPDNSLSSEWFPAKIQLKKLTLRYCSLTAISSDSFGTEPFEVLRSLALIDNRISVFKKPIFDPLVNLEEFVITNNAIDQADADLLAATSNALQIIQMDNAISSEDTLVNITGKSALSKVLLLSLTGNLLQNISANAFKGVPNVQSIYLTNSGISSVQANAFDPFSGAVRQLFLAGNKISSLPKGVFNSILKTSPNFVLTLGNNDWNCCCELQWLKNLTSTYQILNDEPRCATPDWNAGLRFSEATFCGMESYTGLHESTDSSYALGTTKPIDQDTTSDNGLITLMCPVDEGVSKSSSRKLLAIQEFEFRSRFPWFSVQEKENGSVYVSLTTTKLPHTLIWFGNDLNDLGVINCIANVKESLYLDDLTPGGLYTICLLDILGALHSPFNCISLHKKTTHEESLWLANEDKTAILCALGAALIFVCLVSVIGSYYVVRRNPELLKGSKRIIMVQHRAADAIVLPEGLRLESLTKDLGGPAQAKTSMSSSLSHKDYMTPMSKRKLLARKGSVTSGTSSRSSANSYVSGIEPTTMQLISWRLGRIRDHLSCDDRSEFDDPPPPPPPRNKSIPSLSLNIDERETSTSNDHSLISIFRHREEQEVNLDDGIDEERL